MNYEQLESLPHEAITGHPAIGGFFPAAVLRRRGQLWVQERPCYDLIFSALSLMAVPVVSLLPLPGQGILGMPATWMLIGFLILVSLGAAAPLVIDRRFGLRVTIDEARDEVVIRPSALERWFGSPARSAVSVNGPRSGPEFLCFARSDVIAVQRCNRLLRGTELVEEQVNLVVRNEDSQLYRVLISQQYEAKWIDALARSYAQYLNCLVLDHREVLPSK